MSRQAAGASDVSVGKGAVGALIVVATALALLLIVRARPAPDPFDPRSSAADGATGLVALLERSDADLTITRSVPEPSVDTRLLILDDRLDDSQRSGVLDFIEAGGFALVADPASTLHGGPALDGGSVELVASPLPEDRLPVSFEANITSGRCTIGALDLLRGLYVPDGVLFPVGPTEPQCFTDEDRSFVIARNIGDGLVVGLGDNEVFVNRYLRRADNAALAVALLAPQDGVAVTIVLGTGAETTQPVSDVGTGDETLLGLVPRWVWMSLVMAAIAFVVFAVSRSVRIGGVVDEPLATTRAGSDLVAATGNLMQRAKHAQRAGWLMQSQLHRDLCRELHVDLAAPLPELDAAVVARGTTAAGEIEALLQHSVHDDAALLALSGQIDRIRKDVLT